MKYIPFFLLLLIAAAGNAQENERATAEHKDIVLEPIGMSVEIDFLKWDRIQAKKDIENHEIKLFITPWQGGKKSFKNRRDVFFQKQYHVTFQFIPYSHTFSKRLNCLAYNEVVFEYLDAQYGPTWRTKIRKDAFWK